jgi:hypothetical protein
VYLIEIQTVSGAGTQDFWTVAYRYSELLSMHEHIKTNYTSNVSKKLNLPKFPGKKLWGNSSEKVIKERKI